MSICKGLEVEHLSRTIDPLYWDGDDRPSAVNEPRSLNYYNKYMASKLVDAQFAIY
jgi:hypothetical protein